MAERLEKKCFEKVFLMRRRFSSPTHSHLIFPQDNSQIWLNQASLPFIEIHGQGNHPSPFIQILILAI
jgi:hypothetical protein